MPLTKLAPGKEALLLQGNERWFLVQSQPRNELRAQTHLSMQGFRTYIPLILKTTRHARRLRTFRAPLFPRYLFIILDLGRDRWLSVRSTVGVASLFTCDDRPIAVPSGIVEALIERSNDAATPDVDDGLRNGQTIRIISGAFASNVGILERLDEKGRVQVLLDMMGGTVRVNIDRFRLVASS
jgi:transcription elongation factor/antiterminator RfaH